MARELEIGRYCSLRTTVRAGIEEFRRTQRLVRMFHTLEIQDVAVSHLRVVVGFLPDKLERCRTS